MLKKISLKENVELILKKKICSLLIQRTYIEHDFYKKESIKQGQ